MKESKICRITIEDLDPSWSEGHRTQDEREGPA
jgi:hypothetical protein